MENSEQSAKADEDSNHHIASRAAEEEESERLDEEEEFQINPPTKFLTDKQRHVLIGLIGLCIVVLMSFSLLMVLNILKG